MSENEEEKTQSYEGRTFDEPLIVPGHIDAEPERYIAEKPFDLTRFEYSVLKKPYTAEFWFTLVAGATVGVVISIIGKTTTALVAKQSPSLESWEIITVLIGVVVAVVFKKCLKSEDDQEKDKLMRVIDSHFEQNRPRHLHLTKGRKR